MARRTCRLWLTALAFYTVARRWRPSRGFSFARRTGKVHRRASYGTHDLYRGRSHCGEAHMKSTWTANWTDRITDPAAAAAGAIFIVSLATLAGAWFFEYVVKIAPCPLCLAQRIPYHVIIPLSLLLAIAALAHAPRALLTVGFAAIAIAACCGVVLGIYHSGVEWHWWPGPADCSGPLTDLRSGGSLLDQLHGVHVVRCDEAAWRFLGLSLAGYNVLISLALASVSGLGLVAARAAPSMARPLAN